MTNSDSQTAPVLQTLPGDEVRQIMWRFAERFDLQMAVQSARGVARGPVARLVAAGERNNHEWTEAKNELLAAFDAAGLTAAFMEPELGGFIAGPKNLAVALIAFELGWVDGGAATCSLAGNLALSPIHERGTDEQRTAYMSRCVPSPANSDGPQRGAFCLTEPLPYVGVDTGVLGGKIRVAAWEDGQEPVLQVEKRGRFITNMDFASFVVAAVDADDDRIKGSCMVILEETDPGTYDRGAPTQKLVHQLSSTCDPVFNLEVPANRIVGGYDIVDGVIVPRFSHGQVIEAVFQRTRVTVGAMSAAKLLSAVEPIIRYQRTRFRGGDSTPGTPRHDLGLQMKEDSLQRLVDVWATGEAAASLVFAAARLFDRYDPLEEQKNQTLTAQGIRGARAQFRTLRKMQTSALEYLELIESAGHGADDERLSALEGDPLIQFLVQDSLAQVLCPACKLWNTGYGANMMREAVSLMGGYGVTEDCPGFLPQKWVDAQLEATYEGPEAVQRRQLSITMTNALFLAQFRGWIRELSAMPNGPAMGAGTLAAAMELWDWSLQYLQGTLDADGHKLYRDQRHGVTFPMTDALCWLLASHQMVLDVTELSNKGEQHPVVASGLPGTLQFMRDLCHVQAARAAGEVGRICAELVYGYEGQAAEGSRYGATPDESFDRLRLHLDRSLAGSRLAKDRAATALSRVMIPEALDYPA